MRSYFVARALHGAALAGALALGGCVDKGGKAAAGGTLPENQSGQKTEAKGFVALAGRWQGIWRQDQGSGVTVEMELKPCAADGQPIGHVIYDEGHCTANLVEQQSKNAEF